MVGAACSPRHPHCLVWSNRCRFLGRKLRNVGTSRLEIPRHPDCLVWSNHSRFRGRKLRNVGTSRLEIPRHPDCPVWSNHSRCLGHQGIAFRLRVGKRVQSAHLAHKIFAKIVNVVGRPHPALVFKCRDAKNKSAHAFPFLLDTPRSRTTVLVTRKRSEFEPCHAALAMEW